MDKERKIKTIHKILYLKESLDGNNITQKEFNCYLTKVIVEFSGVKDIDERLKENIIDIVKGIKETKEPLTHAEIRMLILGLMGDIKRSEEV